MDYFTRTGASETSAPEENCKQNYEPTAKNVTDWPPGNVVVILK